MNFFSAATNGRVNAPNGAPAQNFEQHQYATRTATGQTNFFSAASIGSISAPQDAPTQSSEQYQQAAGTAMNQMNFFSAATNGRAVAPDGAPTQSPEQYQQVPGTAMSQTGGSQRNSQTSIRSMESIRLATSGFTTLMGGNSAAVAISTSSLRSIDQPRREVMQVLSSEQAQQGTQQGREEGISQSSISQASVQRDSQNEPIANSVSGGGTYSNVSQSITGTNRKRSRTVDRDSYPSNGPNEHDLLRTNQYQISTIMDEMMQILNLVFTKGDRGRTLVNRAQVDEMARKVIQEALHMTTKIMNHQEELLAALHQVTFLQEKVTQLQADSAVRSHAPYPQNPQYQQAVSKGSAKAIAAGTQLPPPIFPASTRHAPAENILIFKSPTKGAMPNKSEQEVFRDEVARVLEEPLFKEVSAIRPTRYGGYIMIFRTPMAREEANEILRKNEDTRGITARDSCVVAPKKKRAKVVCREPPVNYSVREVMKDLYGSHNPHLHQLLMSHREANIFETRLGWVFEISTAEAAAIQAQGGRIRYSNGRELKVEEFIPLQQCYRCCMYGHNAKECRADEECCRLCGDYGHSGKDCLKKEDRSQWQCANCVWHNEINGTKLPTNHAAAQMHKCSVALNEKMVRRNQLAAAGVFTTPSNQMNQRKVGNNVDNNRQNQGQAAGGGERQQAEVRNTGSGNRRRTKSRSRKQTSSTSSQIVTMPSSSSSMSQTAGHSQGNNAQPGSIVQQQQQQAARQRRERGRSGSRPLLAGWQTVTTGRGSYNENSGGSGTMLGMNIVDTGHEEQVPQSIS